MLLWSAVAADVVAVGGHAVACWPPQKACWGWEPNYQTNQENEIAPFVMGGSPEVKVLNIPVYNMDKSRRKELLLLYTFLQTYFLKTL